jgi:photosystem II stability/assembly factor-like uncharacterized protein
VRSATAVLALALLIARPAVLAAGPATPSFEHVHALAFDAAGRVLWLGAHTGLYRSEDGGKTWTKAALAGLAHGPDVMTIAPDPANAAVLRVGTHEAGVLVTSDGGKTWSASNAGLRGHDVHGLAADPSSPTKLHALVRDTGAGLYRTTDGGRTWVRVDDGPSGETKVLAAVNIPTGMGGIFLYAGTGDGLQRSPDCF